MKLVTEREKLAAHYKTMAANNGLVDVKFFLRNQAEATTEQVSREINAMYEALERGEAKALKFGSVSK